MKPNEQKAKRRVQSPYVKLFSDHSGSFFVGPTPAAELPKPPETLPDAPLHRMPWHQRLKLLAVAGTGALSVVYTGQLQAAIPPNIGTVATVTPPGAGASETAVAIPSQHVAQVVAHVTSSQGQASDPAFAIKLTPAQNQLIIHINQHIDRESDRIVDVVVEVQEQKPSEAEVKDTRNFFRQLQRDVLSHFSDPSKLAEEVGSTIVKTAEHWGWLVLLYARKKTGEAAEAKKNSILSFLARGFDKLREIFDPSHAAQPKKRPIGFLADQMRCSEKKARATLMAGPFVESNPGFWELDEHFGAPQWTADPWTWGGLSGF